MVGNGGGDLQCRGRYVAVLVEGRQHVSLDVGAVPLRLRHHRVVAEGVDRRPLVKAVARIIYRGLDRPDIPAFLIQLQRLRDVVLRHLYHGARPDIGLGPLVPGDVRGGIAGCRPRGRADPVLSHQQVADLYDPQKQDDNHR